MRVSILRRALALLAFLSLPALAGAQSIDVRSSNGSSISGARTGSMTTAGADCATATNCVGFRVDGLPSWGLYLDVGTSGTFNFEVTQDDASDYTSTTAHWTSWTEDVGGNANRTADGAYYFTNAGFRWFRIRASAISGAAAASAARGLSGLKSTASLSGGSISIDTSLLATAAKQDALALLVDGLEGQLTTIDGRVDGIEGQLTTIDGRVDGLETLVGTTNSTLTTIDGRVDGLEGLLGTLNTNTAAAATELTLAAMAADISTIKDGLSIDAIHDNPARNNGPQVMAEFDDTTPDAVDEGEAGRLRISANRNLYASLRDGLGSERGAAVNASNQLLVLDGNSAAAAASLAILDDALFADEGAFTYATSKVVAFGAVAESTTDTLADGTVGAPVMTLSRFLRMTPSGYLSGGGVPVTMKSDNTNNDDKTAICTGPCTVYNIVAFNHAATSAFLRCENDTAANTTPGSETASDGEPDFEIPGNTTGAGYVVSLPVGASFSTALTCWLATGEAATDATDPATDDVTVFFTRVQ